MAEGALQPALLVLLRGINVGGHNKLPMADLRALATALGYGDPRTYIQSGNLLIRTAQPPEVVQATLQAALADRLGVQAPVVVRQAAQWQACLATAPFPDARAERPKLLHLCLAQAPLAEGCLDDLVARAQGGERLAPAGPRAFWIDYAGGVGRSKLTPKALDRAAGSPVTARNWRTVLTLADRLGQA